jgi:hypothetical protein
MYIVSVSHQQLTSLTHKYCACQAAHLVDLHLFLGKHLVPTLPAGADEGSYALYGGIPASILEPYVERARTRVNESHDLVRVLDCGKLRVR